MKTTPDNEELSDREIEILEKMAQGLKNEAIGIELGIVRRTVEQHITNILAKLKVSSRISAILKAIQKGYIDPP